jgi:hypothetical protein
MKPAAALCVLLAALPASAEAARRDIALRVARDAFERFRFETEHTVTTALGPAATDQTELDLSTLDAPLAPYTVRVRGQLERLLAREFRDRSWGIVARVVAPAGELVRGSSTPLDLTALAGRSVSLRVQDSGELLESAGWDGAIGAGREGAFVDDVFLAQLPHLPPKVLPDGPVPVSYRLRLPLDKTLNRDQRWDLQFRPGAARPDCKGCVVLDYEGAVTEVSEDKHPARASRLEAKAAVSGTIVLSDERGFLIEHTYRADWTRTVARPSGQVLMTQTETIAGALRREAP